MAIGGRSHDLPGIGLGVSKGTTGWIRQRGERAGVRPPPFEVAVLGTKSGASGVRNDVTSPRTITKPRGTGHHDAVASVVGCRVVLMREINSGD